MLSTILGNVDRITIGIDIGTELGPKIDPVMVLMMESLRA